MASCGSRMDAETESPTAGAPPHMSRRIPRLPSWLPFDAYLLALAATVALAALLPARGGAADLAGGASTGAVALLFFLYGARLSTAEALDGLTHWRLHLTVLVCTFVVFPLLGLASGGLVPYVLTPELQAGFLFLCLVPSTIQSSIAFTSIARGNVPAAICAGSFSSLAGILVTPLLAALLIGSAGGGFSVDSLLKIVFQLLVPFLAGQLLRRWVRGFLTRHKKVLGLVDRGSILLVVYTAFSEGMVMRRLAPGHPRPARRAARRRRGPAGADAHPELVRGTEARVRPGGPDRHPVRRVEEESGGRAADGERDLRGAREPGRAAADAVPPDAADGLRGDRQAPLARSRGAMRPRTARQGPPPPAHCPTQPLR